MICCINFGRIRFSHFKSIRHFDDRNDDDNDTQKSRNAFRTQQVHAAIQCNSKHFFILSLLTLKVYGMVWYVVCIYGEALFVVDNKKLQLFNLCNKLKCKSIVGRFTRAHTLYTIATRTHS